MGNLKQFAVVELNPMDKPQRLQREVGQEWTVT